MSTESKNWKVIGKVLDAETQEGIQNLLVEVFDQDRSLEERLGSTITDASGEFGVEFTEEDFQAAYERDVTEIKPDLFCRVRSAEGELLAQTEVRHEAGREEAFLILIDKSPENTRARFKTDHAILTRANDTLAVIARRYYRIEAEDKEGAQDRLQAVIARLKQVNTGLADLGDNAPIVLGAEVSIARVPDVIIAQNIMNRDVYIKQLGKLGMGGDAAKIFVDYLNIKGILGLAGFDYGDIITRLPSLQENRCVDQAVVTSIELKDIFKWVTQSKFMARVATPKEPSVARLRLIKNTQGNLAKIVAKSTPKVVVFDPGILGNIFQNSRLQTVKALLRKAGICDISKVGTLRLTHNLDLQFGLYLPAPTFLVDPEYLNWLQLRFTDVDISTFSHTHVASIDWPTNEAVMITTELDLTDKRISIDRTIDTFYIITQRIIYGEGAEITYNPIPLVPATEYTRRATDGVSYNRYVYAGGGHHAYDGGDGQPGEVGYGGNDGHPAPSVEIYTLELPGGLPDIDLNGQPGGRGGRGQQGGNGGNGSRGRPSHGHWYCGCEHGPGFGGDGGDGRKGGMGGIGGAGGRGGSLTVGILTGNMAQVYSRPTHLLLGGGPRVSPGPRGFGGNRGLGGLAGTDAAWNWCSSRPERRGNDGHAGAIGDEYPLHSDPNLAANGITTGHGAEGDPGILNPPVLYTRDEWNLLLNQPWILRLDPHRSVPSKSATEDRQFVLVEGENLTSTDTIYVDGGLVATTFLSDTVLRFEVEFDFQGGGHSVYVRQTDGDESNRRTLTVLPRLDEASPTDVIPGQEVTLSGHAFQPAARVEFAGLNLTASTVNRDEIRFSIPSQSQLIDAGITAGTYPVKVINDDGEQTDPLDLELSIPFTRILVPVVVHRIFSEDDPALGTNATEADIRDFFENSDTQTQRIGYTVNHLLSQAGIQSVLAEIQDHQVRDDWVSLPFPTDNLRTLSGMFNVDFQLNIYLLISFDVAFAWGGSDVTPGDTDQTGAVWMPDLIDIGAGNNTRNNWQTYINALSHEIGHFLTLPHFCNNPDPATSRTGVACVVADDDKIMHPIVGATRIVWVNDEHNEKRARATSYDIS